MECGCFFEHGNEGALSLRAVEHGNDDVLDLRAVEHGKDDVFDLACCRKPAAGSLARFRIPGDGNVLGGLTGERSFLSRGGGMPGDGTVFSSDGRLRPNVKNGPF